MASHLHAERSGPAGAPAVMLLHPMGHSGAIWDRHRELLSDRFQVIAPDLPGHGKSDGPFTVAGSADALAELIDGAPVHVAGLSLGARVALRLAAEHKLASLTLVGCGLNQGVPAISRAVTRLLPSRSFRDGASKQTVLASMAEIAHLDLTPCLAAITARCLVVVGAEDRPYQEAARRIAMGVSGAELRTIPSAGHFWPKDQPEDFVTMLAEWISRGP